MHRLAGDLADGPDLGRRAVHLAAAHDATRWWLSTAAALHGGGLLEAGLREAAVPCLSRSARPAAVGDEAYRLRVAAPLAAATGIDADLAAADALLRHDPPGAGSRLAARRGRVSVGRALWPVATSIGPRLVLEPFAARRPFRRPDFARRARAALDAAADGRGGT